MDFLTQISATSWLKIGAGSLLLGGACAWFLFGAQLGLPKLTLNAGKPPTSSISNVPPTPTAHFPTQQLQAIAPEGILDQYAEFTELLSFVDTEFKPDFVLPPAIAPLRLLDPGWTGVAP